MTAIEGSGASDVTSLLSLLEATKARLVAADLGSPALDARLLIQHALDLAPLAIVADGSRTVSPAEYRAVEALVARRLAGEPVDRIVGRRGFRNLDLFLSPGTLSPRPDTEVVVEAALQAFVEQPQRILDLGTGSGAIVLALLAEWKTAFGVGVDLLEQAAVTARMNAEANGLSDRAAFVIGHWASAIEARFDLVISNPPYIESSIIPTLEREVREHDPHLALDGGADGLQAYREIVAIAPSLLVHGGVLVLELGAGQEAAVALLCRAAGLQVDGPARRDLGGVPRALVARFGD